MAAAEALVVPGTVVVGGLKLLTDPDEEDNVGDGVAAVAANEDAVVEENNEDEIIGACVLSLCDCACV